jgi:hypothetical protein
MVKALKRQPVVLVVVLLLSLWLGWLVFRALASPMVPSGGGAGQGALPAVPIVLGEVDGTAGLNVFGRNADLDAASSEDLWEKGGDYVFPTAARIHDIKSTDPDDDGNPADTGARTVYIEGLDSNHDVISEIKTLEGTTNVPTTSSYLRVNRFLVLTAGSTGTNEGTLTATAQVDGTVSAQIGAGKGQANQFIYTVPNEKKAVLMSVFWTYSRQGTELTQQEQKSYVPERSPIQFKLKTRPNGQAWRVLSVVDVDGTASSCATYTFQAPLVFDPKTDLKVEVWSPAENMVVGAAGDFFLIDQ